LQILKTRGPDAMNAFYDALLTTGQEHLAEKLKGAIGVRQTQEVSVEAQLSMATRQKQLLTTKVTDLSKAINRNHGEWLAKLVDGDVITYADHQKVCMSS
jgi:hypothetical protein